MTNLFSFIISIDKVLKDKFLPGLICFVEIEELVLLIDLIPTGSKILSNWQNDLTVSFQPTLINEVLTYQFNPQNQVRLVFIKFSIASRFLYPIIDEGARSDAGDVRGNLMYENRINGKTFSLINSFSQALYQDRELGNFFQYSATLNYVYAGFG